MIVYKYSGSIDLADNASSVLNSVSSKAENFTNKMTSLFKNLGASLTASITAPIAALGVTSVKTFADFEQSIANAAAISKASAEDLEKMEKLARKMGATTKYTAAEAADGLTYMAQAGWKVSDMEKALGNVLSLASATNYGLADSSNVVISALAGFGKTSKEAGRFVNVFASACSNSLADMPKLSTSMSYLAPVANALGYSVEDATASLMVLYDAGLDGSSAGNKLKTSLARLLAPTKQINTTLKKLGLTAQDVNPQMHSLEDIFTKLNAAGMDAADAAVIFGKQNFNAGLVIAKNVEKMKEYKKAITDTNSAEEMSKKQLDTLTGSYKILQSALDEVKIGYVTLYRDGLKKMLDESLIPFITKIGNLNNEAKETIVKFAGMAAAAGPLLLVVSKILPIFTSLLHIVSAINAPIAAIIAGVTLLTASFASVGITIDQVKAKFCEIIQFLTADFQSLVGWIKNFVQENKALIDNLLLNIYFLAVNFGEAIAIVYNYIKQVLSFASNSLSHFFSWALSLINTGLSTIINLISLFNNILSGNFQEVALDIKNIVHDLLLFIGKFFLGIKEAFVKFNDFIATGVVKLVEKIFQSICNLGAWIEEEMKWQFEKADYEWAMFWESCCNIFNRAMNAIKGGWNKLINKFGIDALKFNIDTEFNNSAAKEYNQFMQRYNSRNSKLKFDLLGEGWDDVKNVYADLFGLVDKDNSVIRKNGEIDWTSLNNNTDLLTELGLDINFSPMDNLGKKVDNLKNAVLNAPGNLKTAFTDFVNNNQLAESVSDGVKGAIPNSVLGDIEDNTADTAYNTATDTNSYIKFQRGDQTYGYSLEELAENDTSGTAYATNSVGNGSYISGTAAGVSVVVQNVNITTADLSDEEVNNVVKTVKNAIFMELQKTNRSTSRWQ